MHQLSWNVERRLLWLRLRFAWDNNYKSGRMLNIRNFPLPLLWKLDLRVRNSNTHQQSVCMGTWVLGTKDEGL